MNSYSKDETVSWISSLEKRMSSAGIAVCDESGRVLVVKAHYKRYWSFPGGVVDAGETPAEAATRETLEEVNLEIEPSQLSFKMIVNRISDLAQTYQFIFECIVDSDYFNDIVLDNDEIEDWALVSRDDIIAGDRYYSKSTKCWAEGFEGYLEQEFGDRLQADI